MHRYLKKKRQIIRIACSFILGVIVFMGKLYIKATLDDSKSLPFFAVVEILFSTSPTSIQKQGRIHGNTVADGWAGAVVRKPLGIQKCDLPTFLPTDTASSRVACPRLKIGENRERMKSSYTKGKNVRKYDK